MVNHETLEQLLNIAIPVSFVGGLVLGNVMDYVITRYSTLCSLGPERRKEFASEHLEKWRRFNPLVKIGTYGRKVAYEKVLS